MNISELIVELLQQGKKVEINGIGTFESVMRNPHHDPRSNTYYPASRVVAFSEQLQGDESIVDELATRECISRDVAKQMWHNYVDALSDKMARAGEHKFGKMGTLKRNAEGHFGFEMAEGYVLGGDADVDQPLEGVKIYSHENEADPFARFEAKQPTEPVAEVKVEPVPEPTEPAEVRAIRENAEAVRQEKERAAEAERRKAEEKAAEERRKAEEKAAEERRKAEEKAAEEQRKAEKKAAEERRKAEEAALKAEEKRLKDEKEAAEKAVAAQAKVEAKAKAEEEKLREAQRKAEAKAARKAQKESEQKEGKKKRGWLWVLLILLLLLLLGGAAYYYFVARQAPERSAAVASEPVSRKDVPLTNSLTYNTDMIAYSNQDMYDNSNRVCSFMSEYIDEYLARRGYTNARMPMLERVRQYADERMSNLLGDRFAVQRLLPYDDYIYRYCESHLKKVRANKARVEVQTELMQNGLMDRLLDQLIDDLGLQPDQQTVAVAPVARPAAQQVATPASTPEPTVSAHMETSSKQGFDVIAGFFLNRDNATRMAARLHSQGCDAYIIEKSGKYYVSMGSAPTRTAADALYKHIKGWYDGDIVIKQW